MIQKFTQKLSALIILFLICSKVGESQNSVLVNFGDSSCAASAPVSFSLIRNPLTSTPAVLTNCSMAAQLPDYFSVFIAYNPKNQKIYVADIRTGVTKIWVMDMGLPNQIVCPAIPVVPNYSYSYISNNFEFDNNGALWSLSNYNPGTGQCNIDEFDVNTGNIISTRLLQFPAGNFPTSITSGDLIILPNGRMFATMGAGPSRLYEFNNYSGSSATATYLKTIPKNCFGLAYLNGELEVTGFDASGCYFYEYVISSNTLSTDKPFQNGQTPIDNTSFSPTVGTTKRLKSAVFIDPVTADLVYEVFVTNMGNVTLNNINVTDDLATPFGAANVSNVTVNFVPGANAGGLMLNTAYNGVSNYSLLTRGQRLPNKTSTNQDYFFKAEIHCRVTNLMPNTLYLNSAVANASIGSLFNNTLIRVIDSSNNGNQTVVDPNQNSNPSDIGENIPTPFIFNTVLPVHFINISAAFVNKTAVMVRWEVAVPTVNAAFFEPQFSPDGITWTNLSRLSITDPNRANYQYLHTDIPSGKLFYRIKQIDNDGSFIYSKTVLLQKKPGTSAYTIYPNPADKYIEISGPYSAANHTNVELYDAIGRLILRQKITSSLFKIPSGNLPAGTYVLKIISNEEASAQKILITH